MQARGPLMVEHRLIERMLAVVDRALAHAERTQVLAPQFVDAVVDFVRVYADRTHHGKEEDILFKALETKAMSDEDRATMNKLIEDHRFGRQTTKALVEANMRHRNGDASALADILSNLRILTEFYPRHIEAEDRVFFPATRRYFSDKEDQAMLAAFWEFDRKLIHEKYKSVVEALDSPVETC
jgi:hemerythrin-like domain-containing protein